MRVRREDRLGVQREREADEVGSPRDHSAAGPLDGEVGEGGVQDPFVVVVFHVLADPVRDDFPLVLQVGRVHSGRSPDVFVHVVIEALARDVLDDAGHDVPGVGRVAVLRARLEEERVVLEDLDRGLDRVEMVLHVHFARVVVADSRGVGHQVADRDRVLLLREGREVRLDLGVEVDGALVHELHQRNSGDRLRDGRDPVHAVRGRRDPILDIGQARGAAPDQLAVHGDRGRETGTAGGVPGLRDNRRERLVKGGFGF